MQPSSPIVTQERIAHFDVLRGFALYGVLLANTADYYCGLAFLPRTKLNELLGWADHIAGFFINFLVSGKAMTLLTFLFGLGFAIQLERAEAKQESVLPMYIRRLFTLMAIGLCHVALLWWGDILWSYALVAFALILFRKASLHGLFYWAIALIFVPQLIGSIPWVAEHLSKILPAPLDHPTFRANLLQVLEKGSFVERARMQFLQAFYHVSRFASWYFLWLLGHFLLGFWAGRSHWLHQPSEHARFFKRLLAWGMGIGLLCSSIWPILRLVLTPGQRPSTTLQWLLILPSQLGTPAMAAAYLAAIVLLMQRSGWRKFLRIFEPVGRMPLTTYITQSLVGTFIFYGWGLGLIGQVGIALCIPLTLGIFGIQIIFSHYWLKRFRFGPLEWIWRSLSYGRIQEMRATTL